MAPWSSPSSASPPAPDDLGGFLRVLLGGALPSVDEARLLLVPLVEPVLADPVSVGVAVVEGVKAEVEGVEASEVNKPKSG